MPTATTTRRRVVRRGTRVRFSFDRHWPEVGTVISIETTANGTRLYGIELDETVELHAGLGGGWCNYVERERDEIEREDEA